MNQVSPRRRGLRSSCLGLTAVAGLLLALVPAGCVKEEYQIGERIPAAGALPAMTWWRFEVSQPRGPMFQPLWLPSLSLVKKDSWPYGLAAAYRPPEAASGTEPQRGPGSLPGKPVRNDKSAAGAKTAGPAKPAGTRPGAPAGTWLGRIGVTWHSEPFDDRTIAARFAKAAGRQFFLVSGPAPRTRSAGAEASDKPTHSLVMLDVDGGLVEHVLHSGVEVERGGGALDFEALPLNDRLVVVYAEGPAIYHMIGTFVHGDLTFSKPELACRAPEPKAPERPADVSFLRLRAGPDRLHILWCQGMQLLHATTTGPWESGWSAPQTISLSANGANCDEGADLIADGQDVFIAWSDNRLRSKWDEKSGYDNDLKLFVAGSRDGGATFSTPVLFSDALEKNVQVDRVFLTLANDKVILCWTEQAKGPWHCGILDRGVRTLEVGDAVHKDKKLHEAYTSRMKTVLGEAPYAPPKLPAAKRAAAPAGKTRRK